MIDTIFNEQQKANTFKYFKITIPILLITGFIMIKFTKYSTLGGALILLSLVMTLLDLYIINVDKHHNMLYISYSDIIKHMINYLMSNFRLIL
jgi:hypothetical protein